MRVDVFILYPHERVSDVQRRQMTGVPDANIHVIALQGTFDDAQTILKGLFRDARFRDEMGLAQRAASARAQILQVADRRRAHGQAPCHQPAPPSVSSSIAIVAAPTMPASGPNSAGVTGVSFMGESARAASSLPVPMQ